jgi:hypothetical protein
MPRAEFERWLDNRPRVPVPVTARALTNDTPGVAAKLAAL